MLECFEFLHIAIVVYIHKINSTCEYAAGTLQKLWHKIF